MPQPRTTSRALASRVLRPASVAALGLLSSVLLASPVLADAPTSAASAPQPSTAVQAQAREVWATTCVTCHGANGAGDGLAATGLPVKPADFADPAWQKQVTDAQIERAIVDGGAAVGKSALMPANPDLANKPEVVAALRAMIRGFGAHAKH
ncbi:MAG TPA: cytochrome c [Candidatus Binatia bacterium]